LVDIARFDRLSKGNEMEDSPKKSLRELHDQHVENHWPAKNWRAWGSWFSWGSPVGLGLGYALVAISTGILFWLLGHR
jgi:hypothetical protein